MRKFLNQIDYPILIAVIALLAFGFIMIASIGVNKSIDLSVKSYYSATTEYAKNENGDILFDESGKAIVVKEGEWIEYPNCSDERIDCYRLAKSHFFKMLFALVVFIVVLKINYQWWRKFALPLFVIVFFMLASIAFFGTAYGTIAKNWIIIPGLGSIQPSEFAKLALIFYFAIWMERRPQDISTFHGGFLPFCIIASILILPIMIQPDLGSTMVLAVIAVAMYFAAGASFRHLFLGALIVILFSVIAISQVDYIGGRFKSYLNPTEENCRPDPALGEKQKDYCWQSEQANIAVGSGGIFGLGLAQGIQKNEYLPQASDDFIFAASAEELGFVRIFLVVFAYFFIAYRGIRIAKYAPDRFGQLLALGITVYVCFQAFVNIGVNISLLPVTGITLPFISFGGSSLLSSLIAVGVLLNISKHTTAYAYSSNWRGDSRSYPSARRHYRRG